MRKKNEIRRNYEEESKAEDQVPSAREREKEESQGLLSGP